MFRPGFRFRVALELVTDPTVDQSLTVSKQNHGFVVTSAAATEKPLRLGFRVPQGHIHTQVYISFKIYCHDTDHRSPPNMLNQTSSPVVTMFSY